MLIQRRLRAHWPRIGKSAGIEGLVFVVLFEKQLRALLNQNPPAASPKERATGRQTVAGADIPSAQTRAAEHG